MNTKYELLAKQYEQKRLALLVAEGKLQFDQGSTKIRLAEMCKELATMQYRVSMGEGKVCLILSSHKSETRQMVIESLDKGRKTWSA